jgi:hypothetical protein
VIPLNTALLVLIEKLFLYNPKVFQDHVQREPQSLQLLLQLVSDTQSEMAAMLFHRITASSEALLEQLGDSIASALRIFPLSRAIDFMIKSDRFRNAIPDQELEHWILGYERCHISDIELILQFWPRLWNRPMCFVLLARTHEIAKTKDVHWIHEMKPPSLDLPTESANVIATSLVAGARDMPDGSIFVRLFALSLSDSIVHSTELISCVSSLIFDDREFVAAGALQVMIKWLLNSQIQLAQGASYQAAAQVHDEKHGVPLRHLYSALLTVIACRNSCVASMLSLDANLQYQPEFTVVVNEQKWCFPGFSETLETVSAVKLTACEDSLKVLGCVVDVLGLVA